MSELKLIFPFTLTGNPPAVMTPWWQTFTIDSIWKEMFTPLTLSAAANFPWWAFDSKIIKYNALFGIIQKQLPSKKNGATEKHDKKDEGYKIYGHPALLSFFLLVIFVLAAVVLRRKFRKKTQSPVVLALAEVATQTNNGRCLCWVF